MSKYNLKAIYVFKTLFLTFHLVLTESSDTFFFNFA